jgi:hypothetical protein
MSAPVHLLRSLRRCLLQDALDPLRHDRLKPLAGEYPAGASALEDGGPEISPDAGMARITRQKNLESGN